MAVKTVFIENLGEVTLKKRRGSRHLRISVAQHRGITVSMPAWTPYAAGIAFAKSKTDWILAQQSKHQDIEPLGHGMRIGKAHRISLSPGATRVRVGKLEITGPTIASQTSLTSAAERALRKQALSLLPQRLAQLAAKHGFSYRRVVVKKMHSRWGSCSSDGTITLNIFLMQLPWDYIDYVLMHELVHTRHLNHSAGFWQLLESLQPNTKAVKKIIKTYPTQIMPVISD